MSRDRLWELLADRATQGLSEHEGRELDALLRKYPEVDADAMDRAAAAVDLSVVGVAAPMPAALRDRINASIPIQQGRAPSIAVIGKRRSAGYLGWLAAAACLVIAVAAWWPRPTPTPASERLALLSKPGTIRGNWGDWDKPEVTGVKGEVVWNESEQRGYMTFTGLPAADPAKQVYQLWIIDERGMEQRISGAIFDARGSGEVVVPISPRIKTRNAAAFAVTIEAPGGTWVSDMKRRVVIAQPKQG